ncbi:MAG: hypothetical protein FWH40_05620 [Coriobacteriia bacterium]|nr:hypothetical protein [Coriobacteriia bacterium]
MTDRPNQAEKNQGPALPPELIPLIDEFAREQSRYYLDRAQMTYWEKLQDKVSRTRGKINRKLSQFKIQSSQSEESQADLSAYMTDFISDLISQGVSPEDALEQASRELAFDSGSMSANELSEHYAEHFGRYFDLLDYTGLDRGSAFMAEQASVGLYYSGGVLIGLVLGSLTGLFIGLSYFASIFWLAVIIGALSGSVLGVGLAMLLHARALHTRY